MHDRRPQRLQATKINGAVDSVCRAWHTACGVEVPVHEKIREVSLYLPEKNMKIILQEFVQLVAQGRIEIYNEFSLQHEFGIHLRGRFQDMKVQFERNVSFFFQSTSLFIKKEIDISVFSADKKQKHSAIELKFPRNGQYPEQMFSFCKDIAFAEQLKQAGFAKTYFIVFADDRLFYKGVAEGIYSYFRGTQKLNGTIQKPTGSKNDSITICGTYSIQWEDVVNGMKYVLVET